MRTDMSLLMLRVLSGGLMAGHGAQKLFGAFDGPGRQGTEKIMGNLGLRPAPYWGLAAGASEFGGGALTALGLLSPLGSLGMIAAMSMASGTVHRGKPIWATSGGAELPVTYGATALALAIAGPGALSLDRALGLRMPAWLTIGAALATAGLVGTGLGLHLQAQQPSEARPTEEHPLQASA